jgi:hypothetical protein
MKIAAPAVTPEIEALAADLSELTGVQIPPAVAFQAGKALAAQLDAAGHSGLADRILCRLAFAVSPEAVADITAAALGL